MATRAPLPSDSLLALAELLSSGPGNGDEDTADSVRSAAGAVAGGGGLGLSASFRRFLSAAARPRERPFRAGVYRAPESWWRLGRPAAARGRQGHLERRGGTRRERRRRLVGPPGAAGVRPRPAGLYRYEIVFKQQVRTEDLFLGMSRKDPSTACCEDMLIKIKLPDTKASDITLDIQEKLLDFRSPQKRLLLHLPHPVDTTNGKARFLSEQATLEVTLRMKRELDFINFS